MKIDHFIRMMPHIRLTKVPQNRYGISKITDRKTPKFLSDIEFSCLKGWVFSCTSRPFRWEEHKQTWLKRTDTGTGKHTNTRTYTRQPRHICHLRSHRQSSASTQSYPSNAQKPSNSHPAEHDNNLNFTIAHKLLNAETSETGCGFDGFDGRKYTEIIRC